MYKKILIKISGEELSGETAEPFCDNVINKIVNEILFIKEKGTQTAIVVGGGNFWRGRDAKPSMDRVKADQLGMLATVMNAVYLAETFRESGAEAVIMTPIIVGTVTEQFNNEKAKKYLDSGVTLIFAGGTGHPFFSTDTIAAIRAAELKVDAVLFAKHVDGVYDSDPRNNSMARKIDRLTYGNIIKDDLKVIDLTAAQICAEQKIRSVIYKLSEPSGIAIAASGDEEAICKIGTIVDYK